MSFSPSRWSPRKLIWAGIGVFGCGSPPPASEPAALVFKRVQPELFGEPGAWTNSWVDYDSDGDLDLFIGMRFVPNHLYRNDGDGFVDVASDLGVDDMEPTRAAAWGDYDGDGHLDLYVGFAVQPPTPNRLYRNDGSAFSEVASQVGVDLTGQTRQPVWVDYDGDDDLDLFVAVRNQPNRLFRNEGPGAFVDITDAAGIGDTRRTVGVVWFDFDRDGDLDAHVSNQNGDEDGFFRNEGDGTFTDVAAELGMNRPGRAEEFGSVGPAVVDYDNDGDLDLFIASYGPDVLWSNNGDGTFSDVTAATPLGADYHSVSAAWADANNDGWADLVVSSFLGDDAHVQDHLFLNDRGTFRNEVPAALLEHGPSHGVAWADFDGDGDMDLSVANVDEQDGSHHLYQNMMPTELATRSIQVSARDASGRWLPPGSEVQLVEEGSGTILGTRLVDSGGGYNAQGASNMHFGMPVGVDRIEVRLIVVVGGERRGYTQAVSVDGSTSGTSITFAR